MTADEGGQEGIEVGEVSSHGGVAHLQGYGEARERHRVDAAAGHDALGEGEDAGVLLQLTVGELGRVALEVLCVGAEDSVWGSHGEATVVLGKLACQGFFS